MVCKYEPRALPEVHELRMAFRFYFTLRKTTPWYCLLRRKAKKIPDAKDLDILNWRFPLWREMIRGVPR